MDTARKTAAITAPLAEQDYSPDLEAALAASYSAKGDVSGLSPQDREQHYIKLCRALRLNPLTQPLQWLRLNGKEVLYVARGATDQLAALNRLTRETIRGPEVVDIGGQKVALCVVRATLPDGRSETAHATLPLGDPANLYMKLETKAKRRATLSILGLGMLDETELETIPQAQPSALTLSPHPEAPAPASSAWESWLSELQAAETLQDVRAAYLALADQLREAGEDPAERLGAASRAVDKRVSALGYRIAAAELREMLAATPDAGRLVAYAELVQALEQSAESAARWWRAQRASVPAHLEATVKRLLARRIATSQDAAGTCAAGRALADALARLDTPPGPLAHLPAAPALEAFLSRVGEIELPGEAVAVWIRHRNDLAQLQADDRDSAWRALCQRVEEVGRMKNARVWLKKAIAEEDARRSEQGPDEPPPRGGLPVPQREPGDESEPAPAPASDDWQRTAEGREAHAAGLSHPNAVLAIARKHCDLPGYARVLAARLVALSGTDAQGTMLSEDAALARVNGAMAQAQRDRRAAADAAAKARRAA